MPRLIEVTNGVFYDLDPDSPFLRIVTTTSTTSTITHANADQLDYVAARDADSLVALLNNAR